MENILEAEMDALVKSKVYPNREELIRDAFRALLRAKPNLKIESAVDLYLSGDVSFSRAAELAGLCSEDLKSILAERCIPREVLVSSEKTFQKAHNLLHSE